MSNLSPEIILVIAIIGAWAVRELYSLYKSKQEKDTDLTLEKINNVDQKVDKVTSDLSNHKEQMPRDYVLKDDFYREINKVERKMDDQMKLSLEISKNVSELVGMLKKEG